MNSNFFRILLVGCLIVIYNQCYSQNINQNGYVKFTYPNGKLSSEGRMVNGKPDGFWKTFYVTGVIKSEGTRRNFLLDSIWLFYNELSDTVERISYVLGKRNGYYYQYSSIEEKNQPRRNVIISKELYVNDKREGLAYYYYPNGKLREVINYKNNKKHGIGKEFNKDSVIITIYEYFNDYMIDKQNINRVVKDKKEGVWKEFYNNGAIKSEKVYNDNQITGHLKEFDQKGNVNLAQLFDNGRLIQSKEDTLDIEERLVKDNTGKIIKRSYYKKGVPTGILREYDGNGKVINALVYNENGIIVSQGIVNDDGSREGKWQYFFEDGEVKSVGMYENNRQEGEWNFFFKGGKTEQTGKFSKGMLNAEWKWFYQGGSLVRVENYKDGKREGKYIELSLSGDTVVKGNYLSGEKDGFWRTKFGEIIEEGNYKNDLKEELWKTYFLDGILYYQGNYIQGNADGRHVYYYEITGKIREEQFYVNGFKEKVWKKYNPDGTVLLTINYQNDLETRINGVKIEKKK